MADIKEGQVINTIDHRTVKILRASNERVELGEGGQGIVYKVEYDGKPMALKWFKAGAWNKPDAVYKNLKRNIERKSPTDGSTDDLFLWPIDLTEWIDGSFGYVMELRPPEYIEFTDVLVSKGANGFPTFKAVIEVCIKIVTAFRLLHNAGYSYQDMNSGNFFIYPQKGRVLICDNDNVAPNGTNMGVIGTPQYMAPEIVATEAMPSTQTDEFSLAIVLFFLLCKNHPLEGERWMVPCLTPDIEKNFMVLMPYSFSTLMMMQIDQEKVCIIMCCQYGDFYLIMSKKHLLKLFRKRLSKILIGV